MLTLGPDGFAGEDSLGQTGNLIPAEEPGREAVKSPEGRLFQVDEHMANRARLMVMGVGGGGCNAIDHMVLSGIQHVEFVAINTDAQVLERSHAPVTLQIGAKLTEGLGAGANPEQGRKAAQEDTDKIEALLKGCHMLFITAGMGGGTGTGAAPVIAEVAQKLDILTVGVVTKPFVWEGAKRMASCNAGLEEFIPRVDASLVIPNQNLLHLVDKQTPMSQAFSLVNEVLRQAVQGISDIIMLPGLINVDFADVRKILKGKGRALMGTGGATSEDRAVKAVRQAIHNPLLEGVTLEGARSVLVNVTGGPNVTLHEVEEAMDIIHGAASPEAEIIHGHVIDETLRDGVRVTVIAAGFDPVNKPSVIQEAEAARSPAKEPDLDLARADELSAQDRDNLEYPAYLRRQGLRRR